MDKYQVIVGNIGVVYSGDSSRCASSDFFYYKRQSEAGLGREAYEPVYLLLNGEIIREHSPKDEGDQQ